jgi:hypothetical protein
VEYVVFNITLRESFRVFFALYTILVCLVVIGMTVLSSISVSDDLWLTLSIIMLIMLSILFAHHLVSMSGFRQGAPEGPGVLKRTAAVGGALVWTWTGGAVVFVPIVVAIVEFYPVISEMI